MLLDVNGLSVRYGAVRALDDAGFNVDDGEIVAMIGPNGAGKSSALKAVSGVLDFYNGRVVSGNIKLDGKETTGLASHQLVAEGLAIVPEGRRVFSTMTVKENLEMGAYTIRDRSTVKARLTHVLDLFPRLKERLRQSAGTLSGGEQQMVALGRSLMTSPKLLVADEPSLGLSPNFVDAIFEKFEEINKAGVSVLVVEQNARMALEIADRAYVFEIGRIAFSGPAKEIAQRSEVQQVFFGG